MNFIYHVKHRSFYGHAQKKQNKKLTQDDYSLDLKVSAEVKGMIHILSVFEPFKSQPSSLFDDRRWWLLQT